MQLLNANDKKNLPPLDSTDGDDNPMIWVKIYDPTGNGAIFLAEYDGYDTVYAIQTSNGVEDGKGYMSLIDMARAKLVRDWEWDPKNLEDAIAEEKELMSMAIDAEESDPDTQLENKTYIKIGSLIV